MFGVRTFVAVAQEGQVGVVLVSLVVDEELLEVSVLRTLVVEEQLAEHFVQR